MRELSQSVSRNILYEMGKDTKGAPLILGRNKALMKFEAKKGVTIRNIPFSWFMAQHKEAAIDPQLIEQKVLDMVIQGAEFIPIYDKAARIITMTAPKEEINLISYTGFKVKRGITGARVRRAGGYFDVVELDCSQQAGLRRIQIAMQKTWIRDAKWDAIAECLAAAGKAMYDDVMIDIVSKYETDVNAANTDTVANWGADHYKALLKGLSLIAAAQMHPTIALINPTEIYDLGILDYFIHGDYTAAAARMGLVPPAGFFGYLLPPSSIPIYYHYKVTTAKMTIADVMKSVFVGIRQELTIEDFNDVINGEEGAVLTMQWDCKSGKDARNDPTAKAWAVVTGA